MKQIKILLILVLLISSGKLFAQTTADAVIGDYLNAIGGKDKLSQLNSVYMVGTLEVMGNSGESTTTILNGKGYKNEIDFGGQKLVQVVKPDGGWMINPFMGSPNATAMPQDQYIMVKDELFIGGPLVDYNNRGYTVNLSGVENVDGKPAYKIEGLSKDSVKSTYYIDSVTHYLDELTIEYNGQATTAKFSDFKKTDFGNIMPFSEEITTAQGMQITFTISKVEANKPVDVSIFDMPKQ